MARFNRSATGPKHYWLTHRPQNPETNKLRAGDIVVTSSVPASPILT